MQFYARLRAGGRLERGKFVKKIAVWGTGKAAEGFFHRNWPLRNMVAVLIDRNPKMSGQYFYEKKVLLPEEIVWSEGWFVVVAVVSDACGVKAFLQAKGLKEYEDFADYKQLEKYSEFFVSAKACAPWLPDVYGVIQRRYAEIMRDLHDGTRPMEALLRYACDADKRILTFSDGCQMEFSNLHDLSVIIEELLIDEEYYFETDIRAPTIIDGGANIGLAIYYFKKRYPNARIIAFEPVKTLYEIICRNIVRNHWENVDVYPYALSDAEEKRIFYKTPSSLAGSLTRRYLEDTDEENIETSEVRCVPLAGYLGQKIAFLKLDVEGSELKALRGASTGLARVERLFIEFHKGRYVADNSLVQLLAILEDAGFDYQIGKSRAFSRKTQKRPMAHIGKKVSELIWAKQIRRGE